MNPFIVKAFAKINLAIDVLQRREDGYHDIDMVTIPLKLHDTIEISPMNTKQLNQDIFLYCDDPEIICDESNLAYKALKLMRNKVNSNIQYQMMIHKRIPIEAGLGGGSADAAAVIKAMESILKEKEREEQTNEIALKVGSDVPFCLLNKPCRVQGIGEKLTEIKIKNHYYVLLVKPKVGLSTAEIYKSFDRSKYRDIKRPNIDELIKALEKGDELLMQKNMINVLSYPAIDALLIIQELLNTFTKLGMPLNGMSGTGSACFALSRDYKLASKAAISFHHCGYQTYLTEFDC